MIESNKLGNKGQFSTINKGFFLLELSTALIVFLVLLYALVSYTATIQHWLHYITIYQKAHQAMHLCSKEHPQAHGGKKYSWGSIEWHHRLCAYAPELSFLIVDALWLDSYKSPHSIRMVYGL